ncbi:MAG: hypothetical protein M3463_02045 [Verrucomicrobiota bacterium]|nr:hypothetical protein [Verrucomicrobiota bacterium]
MNRNDEHDDLWELLGHARQETLSPFFARNVLRDVRHLQHGPSSIAGWLRQHWQWAVIGSCAVLIAILSWTNGERPGTLAHDEPLDQTEQIQIQLLAKQVSESPDLHVIANLDELLEDNSIWLEEDGF